MNCLVRLVRLLWRPPHVHIPLRQPDGHHRCYCSHRRDDHLCRDGYCLSCGCSYFEQLSDYWLSFDPSDPPLVTPPAERYWGAA